MNYKLQQKSNINTSIIPLRFTNLSWKSLRCSTFCEITSTYRDDLSMREAHLINMLRTYWARSKYQHDSLDIRNLTDHQLQGSSETRNGFHQFFQSFNPLFDLSHAPSMLPPQRCLHFSLCKNYLLKAICLGCRNQSRNAIKQTTFTANIPILYTQFAGHQIQDWYPAKYCRVRFALRGFQAKKEPTTYSTKEELQGNYCAECKDLGLWVRWEENNYTFGSTLNSKTLPKTKN